ncbi:MAG: hypothetical protein ABJB32_04125 [Verrucomicrobiota bacterium]
MKAPSASRKELDSLVVGIELTLTSIIQGVALYFLTDNARTVLSLRQIGNWPYVLAGLLIILIFWSRSVLHTLTLIRWPLEFPHNFFYIGCALGEALLFTRIESPRAWFALSTVYAASVWPLFAYDLRMVRAREKDSAGDAASRLYALVACDQWVNIRLLMPALFLLNLASALSIYARPHFFLVEGRHVFLIGAQVIALAIYLVYVIRFFGRLTPLILATRQEWHTEAERG